MTLVIGGAHAKLSALQEQTAQLAERVAHEWTEEIHDGNVALAAAAANRAKFFAALSHDMRTPLTAIMEFAELAEQDDGMDAHAMRNLFREVRDWGEQLLSIVNDLQDATKLEAGAFEIQVADIDGDEIAEGAVSHMMALADEAGLELTLELHAASPVRADPHRFWQILINLVFNALKYTAEGWVRVRSYQVGNHVVYEVQDSGAGILAEDMPKVFTAFEKTTVAMGRADSTGLASPSVWAWQKPWAARSQRTRSARVMDRLSVSCSTSEPVRRPSGGWLRWPESRPEAGVQPPRERADPYTSRTRSRAAA